MKTTPLSPLRFAGLHENLGVNGGLCCSTIIGIRSGVVKNIESQVAKFSNQKKYIIKKINNS